jgi:hypothetical protein
MSNGWKEWRVSAGERVYTVADEETHDNQQDREQQHAGDGQVIREAVCSADAAKHTNTKLLF